MDENLNIVPEEDSKAKGMSVKFDVQKKIKELMKISPSNGVQKFPKYSKYNGSQKDGINKGVAHKITRPKIIKAKEVRHNKAKQAVSRMKQVKMPPRFANNRSPVKPGLKIKRHKLSSPGLSLLESPDTQDASSSSTGLKFFTSRSKTAATVKINNSIKLSAINGEVAIHTRESGFEKKNIGRCVEIELENKIRHAALESPLTRLEKAGQLSCSANQGSPVKPTRFLGTPSPKKPPLRPNTQNRTPTRHSPRKQLMENIYSHTVLRTPISSPNRGSPRKASGGQSPSRSPKRKLSPEESPRESRSSSKSIPLERCTRSSPSRSVRNVFVDYSPNRNSMKNMLGDSSPRRSSMKKLSEQSPKNSPRSLMKTLSKQSPKNSPRSLMKTLSKQSPKDSPRSLMKSLSEQPSPRKSPRRGSMTNPRSIATHLDSNPSENGLEELDFGFDEIECDSAEDEILKDLLIQNQTPEKDLDSPRRSPRKTCTSKTENSRERTPTTEPLISNRNVKYFPIFEPKRNKKLGTLNSNKKSETFSKGKKFTKSDESQLIIDAGQKEYGASLCKECGTLYEVGNPDDERSHARFHESRDSTLKFNGWKQECQVTNLDTLGGRVIKVSPNDNVNYWHKVKEVLKVVDSELGFAESGIRCAHSTSAFLYVVQKRIVGVLVAEGIEKAYKVIQERCTASASGENLICCSDVPQRVSFGISRIWVATAQRRRGVAARLVDAMRANVVVPCHYLALADFAFSDPTQLGMSFAEKYTKKTDFLVYRRE